MSVQTSLDIDISAYDFLDFGASTGGSIKFAQETLGGKRGIGIDIAPDKVRKAREAGYECLQADLTSLALPDNSVRFVIISHLLEHIPNLQLCEKIIASAARVASDFVYIQGPYFDSDDYLEGLGFRFFYSNWTGHTCHLTVRALTGILEKLGLTQHAMLAVGPTPSSADPFIHPLASGVDQQKYDPKVHPPKENRAFTLPVYKEFVCYIKLREINYWDKLIKSKATAVPIRVS